MLIPNDNSFANVIYCKISNTSIFVDSDEQITLYHYHVDSQWQLLLFYYKINNASTYVDSGKQISLFHVESK